MASLLAGLEYLQPMFLDYSLQNDREDKPMITGKKYDHCIYINDGKVAKGNISRKQGKKLVSVMLTFRNNCLNP